MRIVSQNVLLLVLSGLVIQSADAARLVIPIVSSGDKVYLAAEVELVEKSAVQKKMNQIKGVGAEFLDLVKNNKRRDSRLFASSDGSAASWLDPKVYDQYAGFSKVDNVTYKDPILWGEYLHAPTDYTIGKRTMSWREDYLCSSNECKKSLYDFGQLFEVAYRYYVSEGNNSFLGNIESVLVASGQKQVFDMASHLASRNSGAGPKFKVGVSIATISGGACVLCQDTAKYHDSFERALLSNVRSFSSDLAGVDVFDEASLTLFLKKYDGLINLKKGMPKVSWSSGAPRLSHVGHVGYLTEWQRYANGRLEGYMLDGDYAYLFISREIDDPEKTQFQIFVLKKNSENIYDLHPHTDRTLESRVLMFDDAALRLFSEVMGR